MTEIACSNWWWIWIFYILPNFMFFTFQLFVIAWDLKRPINVISRIRFLLRCEDNRNQRWKRPAIFLPIYIFYFTLLCLLHTVSLHFISLSSFHFILFYSILFYFIVFHFQGLTGTGRVPTMEVPLRTLLLQGDRTFHIA